MKSGKRNGKTTLMVTLSGICMVLVLMGPQWRDEVRAQISAGMECGGVCDRGGQEESWYICVDFGTTEEQCDGLRNKRIISRRVAIPCVILTSVLELSEDCAR
jgi:hypothetical protein